MKQPKFERGDAVIVDDFGLGVIVEEPEWEDNEWTYSVSLNKDDGWGWFGESELRTYENLNTDDPAIKDIEAQD